MAPSLRVEVSPVNIRDAPEIERAIAAFARSSNGGLVVTPSGSASLHRDLIVTLAARHKLPAVYFERFYVAAGGLVSYGADFVDLYRQAASYVDRISKARSRPTCRCRHRPSRAGDQPQDRKGARSHRAARAARPRRRGDRINGTMSAIGT